MARNMKVIAGVLGLVIGGIVGFGIGVFAAMGVGFLFQYAHPNDPSAGSVAIVVIFTAPLGALVGAALGMLTILKRPRLFYATTLPLALLLIGLQTMLSTLRAMDRPRHFELEVRGTPGAEYVGLISVDGDLDKHKGTLPAKFEYTGFRIELAFVLVELDQNHHILVSARADGKYLDTGTRSKNGVHQKFKSSGYSETFGKTSKFWSRMTKETAEFVIRNEVIPQVRKKP